MEIWRFNASIVRLPLAFRLNQQWKYGSGIDVNVDSDTDTPKGNMAAALTSVLTVILTLPKEIWQQH